MNDSLQGPAGPFDEETPRRDAVRTFGAAGAALLGVLGMSASSAEAKKKGKDKRKWAKSEKKGKKDKSHPAAGTTYWASVDSEGNLIAGQGFVSARNIGGKTGQYSVRTDGEEAFDSCAVVGLADDGNHIVLGTVTSPGAVTLRTQRFASDVPGFIDVDSAFSLVVICPAQ